MQKFISPSFWFNLNPGPLVPLVQKLLVAKLVVLILASVFLLLTKKRYSKSLFRKVFKRLANVFITNSILAAFYLFFTYESIPFFSARFWLIIWFGAMAVWLYLILLDVLKIPDLRKNAEREQIYKKYIP